MADVKGDYKPLLEKHNKNFFIFRNESPSNYSIITLFNEDEIEYKADRKTVSHLYNPKKLISYVWKTNSCRFEETQLADPQRLIFGKEEFRVNFDTITSHPKLLKTLKDCFPKRNIVDASKYWDTFIEWNGGKCDIVNPTPSGGSEQTDKPCSNTGQFGGGGTPLQDIKLFLYANNVTKGTIKLSKPQVEVGTFATDWRPNPSDYVHVNNSNFKRINGIAMQHSDVSGKTFLEIQAKDGTVFGIDTWGGTQKLLEQQQAEIEELKKLVQTLETKINV